MKRSPDMEKLEEMLRSSKFVSGGFLGHDERPLEAIIDTDAAALGRLNRTREEIASRMRHITELGKRGLETTVTVEPWLEARVIDARGPIPCPWPHPGVFSKAVIIARRTDTGGSVRWSELNTHMIEAHGFFEGRGSPFRIEPEDLVGVIFA